MTLSTTIPPKSQNRIFWLIVVGLILLTFAVRVYQLDAVNLRGDEAYSVVHWTATPFSERWQTLWRDEPAPVGAFTMYWAWKGLAGTSEFAMRYLSLLGNVAGAAVMVALGRRLLREWRLALLAGLLWAIHPFLIWHAQDARVYGVLSALTPLSFYWLLHALDHPDNNKLRTWLPYILVQTLALYLYYLEPFWMVAQGLYVLILRRDALVPAIKAWVVVLVLSIPVLVQVYTLLFVSEYQGTAGDADFSLFFTWFAPTLLFGENRIPLWVGVVCVVAFAAALISLLRRHRHAVTLLFLWIFAPLGLLYAASLFSSFFRPRYVMTVIPAFILALVMLAAYLVPKRKMMGLALLILLVGGISSVQVFDYFYTDPPKAPDWAGLMDYLADHSTENDTILFGQPDPAIEYYYRSPADLYIIPLEWETDTNARESELDRLLAGEDAVVLVNSELTWETGQYLQAHAQLIPGDTYPNVVQYRAWNVKADEIEHSLALSFGDVAILRGYTLEGNTTLILYWEATAQTGGEYSVLVHIDSAPDAPPVAVLDHAIAGAVISTRTWSAGTVYRDPIALPIDLPAGELTFFVGLKDANGDPIPLDDAPDGRYPLTTIEN